MNISENQVIVSVPKPKNWLGVRHIQYLLLFFGAVIAYGVRSTLSVAIVAMLSDDPPISDVPTYDWDNKNVILSSFFWGYVIPQIGAGQIAKNYGPHYFLAGSMTLGSIATLIVPAMANLGSGGVMACRMMQGICQGFLFPSIHNLLGKWTPQPERSIAVTFVYTGGPLGTVIAMLITGVICQEIGWPVAFYLYGGLGLAWCVLYAILGSNSPEQNKFVSADEKNYIRGSEKAVGENAATIATPWKTIFTSLPFYAVLVAHCGQNWGFWTLMTGIPSYMSGVMEYDLSANGVLSSLPYLVLWILSLVMSPISDVLINKEILSIRNSRKIFNTIGMIIPAISLVGLGFVTKEHKNLAVTILVIAVGFNAATYCGFNVNHIDLSPVHAGTLMGITNCISNICGIVAPLAMQVIIGNNEHELYRWRTIFIITAVFYVVGNTFFVCFGKGEIQWWNSNEEDEKSVKVENNITIIVSEKLNHTVIEN